jgi:hypothetical protein
VDRAIAEASTVLSIGAYIPYAVGYILDCILISVWLFHSLPDQFGASALKNSYA